MLMGPMQRRASPCDLTCAASILLRLMVGMLLLLRRCMSSSASPSALTLTLNRMWASCPAEYLQAGTLAWHATNACIRPAQAQPCKRTKQQSGTAPQWALPAVQGSALRCGFDTIC